MTNIISNIWELYGIKENPFSTLPILVIGGTITVESFVGRSDDILKMRRIIGSKGGSRIFVYGDVGVGKTSFVNVVRHSALENGLFTPFKEIAVQEDWDTNDLILNTLSAIFGTLKLLKEKPISNATFEKLESLFEIGKISRSGGISIAGFGGEYAKEQKTDTLLTTNLHTFFQEIITEINDKTKKETVIHYNNLEVLPEKKIRYIFENLRDFFQTTGVHFIFVGNLMVFSTVQSIPRFASNLSDIFHLETLGLEEVEEVIRKRFNTLRISSDYNIIFPYADDCLSILYDLMEGNIRNILNSLSTAVLEITTERPIILDRNKLARTLKSVLEKKFLHNLTDRPKEVLKEMVKHKEITNKALSDKLKIPRSNLSSYIKDLESKGCVYLRRKNGKDKFWSTSSNIKWSLLEEAPQQTLSIFRNPT
ncbi:winged helix-turn-helix transcriptional regulator [Candidatus Woesearchaeota archaeon]|nr:winged helix-turn-helix transcriptional regulator [Candidatus Woesearchaeota archaeon]